MSLHFSQVIVESLLSILSRKVFVILEQNDVIALLFLFWTYSHLVLVLLLLIISMYLIAGFDISYFSRL